MSSARFLVLPTKIPINQPNWAGREVEMRGINNFPRQLVYPRLGDKGFRAGKSQEELWRHSIVLLEGKSYSVHHVLSALWGLIAAACDQGYQFGDKGRWGVRHSELLAHPGNTEMCFEGVKASSFNHRPERHQISTCLQSLLKPGPNSTLAMQNIYNSQTWSYLQINDVSFQFSSPRFSPCSVLCQA